MSVVPAERRRFEPVSDVLVLAAVERAERHRERERQGVWLPDVVRHLVVLCRVGGLSRFPAHRTSRFRSTEPMQDSRCQCRVEPNPAD